jgi:hypothetical protein
MFDGLLHFKCHPRPFEKSLIVAVMANSLIAFFGTQIAQCENELGVYSSW